MNKAFMDKATIIASVRQALIAVAPDYDGWPAQQQEKFRVSLGVDQQRRIDVELLRSLFDKCITGGSGAEVNGSDEDIEAIVEGLSASQSHSLNWARLLISGMGEDAIFLNESMSEGTTLLDFNTLYDYDYADHLFQEQAFAEEGNKKEGNKEEGNNAEARDYYALRFSLWARVLIKDQFYYATLHSFAGYLCDAIDESGYDVIQRLIPSEQVEGENHGKDVAGGYQFDYKITAAGLEQQLAELNGRWHCYTQQRWLELSQEFEQTAPAVFMVDKNKAGELSRDFIFNNASALKQVRWTHFLADAESLAADAIIVSERVREEVSNAALWLQKNHDEIMKDVESR